MFACGCAYAAAARPYRVTEASVRRLTPNGGVNKPRVLAGEPRRHEVERCLPGAELCDDLGVCQDYAARC